MSGLARKVTAAFAARKSRPLHVPEWGMDLHIFPLTLGQLSRIKEETDDMRRLVRILMVRARNEKGEPLFDAEDAEALMAEGVGAYGPDVVMRVCAEIGAGEFADRRGRSRKKLREDPLRLQMHDLGALLHKTIGEMEAMPVEEFLGWQAWWRIRHDRQGQLTGYFAPPIKPGPRSGRSTPSWRASRRACGPSPGLLASPRWRAASAP